MAHCPVKAMEDAEFSRTRDYVVKCAADGYHAPYSNNHSDDGLWAAYDEGFRAGLQQVQA